jgi:DUF2924 family protein
MTGRRQALGAKETRAFGLASTRATSHVCVHPEKERERHATLVNRSRGQERVGGDRRSEVAQPRATESALARAVRSRAPPRVSGELLIKALAHRLQEKALGGLKPATRRLLESWGRKNAEPSLPTQPVKTRLKAGTVLAREWHGTTHRVTVIDDGYRFDSKRYRSLSEIARTITGSRWSGPLFFGLNAIAGGQLHGAE